MAGLSPIVTKPEIGDSCFTELNQRRRFHSLPMMAKRGEFSMMGKNGNSTGAKVSLIFKPWIACAELTNTINLSTDLSWLNALGQPMQNALATDGRGLSWSRLGVQPFTSWQSRNRFQRWNGFQSPPSLTKKGGRLQDVGACNPAVKAAIDGIVDAGVLPDDSSRYMKSLIFLPPQNDRNSLVIYIRGARKERKI